MTRTVALEVALPLPVGHEFTYLASEEPETPIQSGLRVEVPFGPRRLTGFVMRSMEPPEDTGRLRWIHRILDRRPLVGEREIELARRIARRWLCGPGEALAAFVPAGVKRGAQGRWTVVVRPRLPEAARALEAEEVTGKQRDILEALLEDPGGMPRQTLARVVGASDSPFRTLARKGLVDLERELVDEDVFARLDVERSRAPELLPDQRRCAEALRAALESGDGRGFLLHGVTGSGKTEVYLDAIECCLGSGRAAIVLVPEISLTPQTVERFESRFGTAAVLHSHLTDAERARQWHALHEGRKRIAIGPRSAVFAPVSNLGLLILDEEHEGTFKQQNVPRYHARDVALMRGEIEGAVVVLGSATPSLESWRLARTGRLELLEMPERVGGAPLPEVQRIDMRAQKPVGPGGVFSTLLANLVRGALDRGEQTLLFLNRRGFRTVIRCRRCGETRVCSACDVAMTWYRSRDRILCHHCGREEPTPERCSGCGGPDIRFSGFGTEMVEEAARRLFPRARIARMDSDSMRRRHAHEELFARIRNREIDILVGTQMVAKGLDFPGITLIGVVAADTTLSLPDFRSAERTFQLMTQVAGRAGRGERPGRVVVQSWTPDHYAYETAARHDFPAFAEIELEHRRRHGYPPFGALTRLVFQADDEAKTRDRAEATAGVLRPAATRRGVDILGPCPAPIGYLKGQFRYHLVLRADAGETLEGLFDEIGGELRRGGRGVQVLVDRDPMTMM